ncbi:hypothetical protein GCM10007420_21680 [Glycocaulis albus]|uniref:Single-stranded DNA-binding protein n=1 Tax=Glycocaulis albus TaxID=1382801 RepID=A0ABQ1XW29_9PROT|nr:single-stranded DNA-binding protein [Glycocaulis albus]GGH04890.1 hypothetical protein GCM10007420_21680 [Glycocaulis albus]
MNRFDITGNLGQNAVIREIGRADGSFTEVAFISIASNVYGGKDRQGQPIYNVSWYDVATFRKDLISFLKKNGKKGAMLQISGEMDSERVQADGKYLTVTRFRVGQTGFMQLLRPGSDDSADERQSSTEQRPAFASDTLDDDLPF